VAYIIILSEDRLFSRLLARNLQAHEHQVEVYLVHQQSPMSFLASSATSTTTLWIIDMGWFDDHHEPTYTSLAEWSRHLPQPSILLVDGSWSQSRVQAFHATATITKPFAMSHLMHAVNELSAPPPEEPIQP